MIEKDWPTKKLSEVAEINPRKSEVSNVDNSTKVSFVPMSAVNEVSGTITNPEVRDFGEVKNGYTYFRNGDVIFAKITPCMENGKVAIAENLINNIGFGSTEFHVIRPTQGTVPEWIYSYLRQESIRQEAQNHMTGTAGQQRVPKEYLENVRIPLPPIESQHGILNVLEKVKKAQRLVQEQIEEVENIYSTVGMSLFGNLGKDSRFVQMREVCEVVKGNSPTLKTPVGKYPLVVTAENRKSSNEYQIDATAVCIPLVSSTGHGHADIKRIHYQEGKFALANIMVALLPNDNKELIPKYLYYYLATHKDSVLVPLMKGSANVTIPFDSIKNLEIPLPPVNFQLEVVTKLSKIEQLKKGYLEREELLGQLVESVSNEMF